MAGLIDGEGSIMLCRRGKGSAVRVAIANTNRPLLEWCREALQVGHIVTTGKGNERHRPGYQWICDSQAGTSVLEQIRPYLVLKAQQADMAIEFQRRLKIPADKAQKEWQAQWRQRMRDMNARGPAK